MFGFYHCICESFLSRIVKKKNQKFSLKLATLREEKKRKKVFFNMRDTFSVSSSVSSYTTCGAVSKVELNQWRKKNYSADSSLLSTHSSLVYSIDIDIKNGDEETMRKKFRIEQTKKISFLQSTVKICYSRQYLSWQLNKDYICKSINFA